MAVWDYLRGIKNALQNRVLALDYPWHPQSRYQQLKSISHALEARLKSEEARYESWVPKFISHLPYLQSIPLKGSQDSEVIYWQNGYLPGLDLVCLYTLIRSFQPKNIIEIGSGHSTAVMRKAIKDGNIKTTITCIDPQPRREIKNLADRVINQALETNTNYDEFIALGADDILFFDGSHISLANSDVTVFFMEILPLLAKGVVVHIHDIYLPFDYPDDMVQRGYNEQYLLAQVLNYAGPSNIEIIFPAYWMFRQEAFKVRMNETFWNQLSYPEIEKHGGSFWFKIK